MFVECNNRKKSKSKTTNIEKAATILTTIINDTFRIEKLTSSEQPL
jgi:hypothetical protein